MLAGSRDASHMLSFDVEEYFQVEAAAIGGVGPKQWDSFQKRLAPCVDRILQILSDYGASATFFILGWVVARERDVVRRIAGAGHEIASHGMSHSMLDRLSPERLRGELLESRKSLEDISGRPVVGYRAPTFSITHRTAWAIDVLAETGYRYDSSIFPVRHDRYGVPDAPRFIHHAIGPGGGEVLEIPPLTLRAMRVNWPVGGGGYLRLLPVCLIARALERSRKAGRPGTIYLHPWELDPDQPILPMGCLTRWRHRVNLRRTDAKLQQLLRKFKFLSVVESLERCAGDIRQTYTYGAAKHS